MQQDNYHVSIAEYKTELLSQHIQISLEMAKVEDLKPWIIGLRPCALAATRLSIKAQSSQNPKGLRCGKMLIVKLLENFLSKGL
jgi:hypothetical protein